MTRVPKGFIALTIAEAAFVEHSTLIMNVNAISHYRWLEEGKTIVYMRDDDARNTVTESMAKIAELISNAQRKA